MSTPAGQKSVSDAAASNKRKSDPMPAVRFSLQTASGKPDMPSPASVAAARAALGQPVDLAAEKENERPVKRQKPDNEHHQSASMPDPFLLLMAGGDGPHVRPGVGLASIPQPIGQSEGSGNQQQEEEEEEEEDLFEDSFLDSPDLDLTELLTSAHKSHYFPTGEGTDNEETQ